MGGELDIPPRFYGQLVDTTARVLTWNVWGRYGPWEQRESAIAATLAAARPDIVVLVEAWHAGTDGQAARLGGRLGLPHHVFSGVPAQEDEDALSGVAVLSRWPISRAARHAFGGLRVQYARVAGPRGPIDVFGVVMDAWWLDESAARQAAIRDLLVHLGGVQDERTPLVLCGDLNADPDSAEVRMLSGRTTAPVPGLSFYDAWEVARPGARGDTWSNANPWATSLLWPDRRIDYVFTATPRRGGVGHPVGAALVGTRPIGGVHPSDHYAVQADIRY